MTQTYGDRWRIVENRGTVGQGGQGRVFRVIDTRGEYPGEYALKRVLNPARHERFRSEIEAIKRVSHPNIIRLIDHSALDDPGGTPAKQFLVMPIAEGGNLAAPGRVSLYKGTVDGVVLVGKRLASGLAAAHAQGIIHRDVKPENILFTGVGHEVWLSDFGICLLRELPRNTPSGEVVGPAAFLAPELEYGGRIEVTAAADVYSLGKVLYYLLSGGVIVPRERLHEERYCQAFAEGERHQLLRALLQQMICPLERRLKDMTEVMLRLEKIENWEKEARLLVLSPQALGRLQSLQSAAQESSRIMTANVAARAEEAQSLDAVRKGFEAWLRCELEKISAHIESGGALRSEVSPLREMHRPGLKIQTAPSAGYVSISGIELHLWQPDNPFPSREVLEIWLCEEVRITVEAYVGPYRPRAQPVRDRRLAMIPAYRRDPDGGAAAGVRFGGFLTRKEAAGKIRGILPSPGPQRYPSGSTIRIEAVTRSFYQEASQFVPFSASDWPTVTDHLRDGLKDAVEAFLGFVGDGANTIGS